MRTIHKKLCTIHLRVEAAVVDVGISNQQKGPYPVPEFCSVLNDFQPQSDPVRMTDCALVGRV